MRGFERDYSTQNLDSSRLPLRHRKRIKILNLKERGVSGQSCKQMDLGECDRQPSTQRRSSALIKTVIRAVRHQGVER